jgi:energy-coupling factor transporter ATP-binding protein EcfA2
MAPLLTTQRQRELIEELTQLVAYRTQEEQAIRQRKSQRETATAQQHEMQQTAAIQAFEREHRTLIVEYQQQKNSIYSQYEAAGCALIVEDEAFCDHESTQLQESLEDANTLTKDKLKRIQSAFSEAELQPQQEFTHFKQQCEKRETEINALEQTAKKVVERRCPWPLEPALSTANTPSGATIKDFSDQVLAALSKANQVLQKIEQLPFARFIEDGWPTLIFIFGAILAIYPCYLLLNPFGIPAVIAGILGIPLAIALSVRQVLRPLARQQTLNLLPELQLALLTARNALTAALHAGKLGTERKQQQLLAKKEKELAAVNAGFEKLRNEQTRQLEARVQQKQAALQAQRQQFESTYERQLKQVEAKYPPQIVQLEKTFQARLLELDQSYREQRAKNQQQFAMESQQLVERWQQGIAAFTREAAAMNAFCEQQFPAWNKIHASEWQPPAKSTSAENGTSAPRSLPALRLGSYQFSLQQLPGGISEQTALAVPTAEYNFPVVLSYPECPSLLLEATGEGREIATQMIQNAMLRLLTSFPPGTVRFTVIDPVGLGQNFSAFMHLADYDERLITNRIWTEANHINQRLADLTEHMEKVIQKYLRNEFASIQQYNEHAGEVAEPFQILVIANYPANFSDEAARRLVSIANSGARCGVYTLISTDTNLKLPRQFDLQELEAQAATLLWSETEQRFHWKDAALARWPMVLESPPNDETFTTLVRTVGQLAKDTARVEVPFDSVVPPRAAWWQGDSRSEIEVPLGRAGAKKLQALRLGKGTSQHVLISGKTGSGKSTLLNAMITNLAVHYSPLELQFYLIDFKKGVEFKAYASCRLPHARVIAIESEREFGMSVLERLDLELKHRGDLFRQCGVQDLKGYRNANPQASLPRIMLVIDEFQEFFTTDDKIAHDSALLLDRLVRQGRAFGIHVLLGSQTLAGAYSLARSTLGQMAVRIALQCSEADAHLILSEDNTAARLLNRPGDAIYNDANGMLEGNHPFQVVWLSDHQRETYLREVAEKAVQEKLSLPTPIVFEGNAAADPADNDLLRTALLDSSTEQALAPYGWLGAAVAIKDPTAITFRRQGGSNLLIVGQQEELALGMLANVLISLSAQLGHHTNEHLARFMLLDGARPDSPEAGFWHRFLKQVPLPAKVIPPRDIVPNIQALAAEVDRRLTANEQNSEPLFLCVHNLARFRELKKSEDFGMSFDDSATSNLDKQLTTILREGPALGVHTLLWCDSYSNLNRWLDRPAMRDLEMRVLFQMSANDSSNLMDSPAASRLGPHLALYYNEELGVAEKFRPYGLPQGDWLAWVNERLQASIAKAK